MTQFPFGSPELLMHEAEMRKSKRKAMSVDPACYDLACTFLAEIKGATAEDKTELAEQIQRTVEDFIASLLAATPPAPG